MAVNVMKWGNNSKRLGKKGYFCAVLQMEKGKRLSNSTIDKKLRYILNKRGLTVIDCCKVLYRSKVRTHSYLNNPYLLTMQQFYVLAGFLRVDFRALFLAVYSDSSVKELKEDGTLSDLLKGLPPSIEDGAE